MDTITPARDMRARRAAKGRGLHLSKTRCHDPLAPGYGTYSLIDPETGDALPGAYRVPFDVVETMLDAQEPYRRVARRRALTDA